MIVNGRAPAPRAKPTPSFKVVLLGEGCVGKTSIVLRYVEDQFNPQHISTLQAAFLTKKVNLPDDGGRAQLNIWDTAGQERFHALGPIYYRGSHAAILVYDITDQDSFQKVKNWVKELKRVLGAQIVITIVGNKTDLETARTVEHDTAQDYADSVGAHYFETSAKANVGIDDLFLELTMLMVEQHAQREQETNAVRLPGGRGGANRLIVEDSHESDESAGDHARETNSSCCGAG